MAAVAADMDHGIAPVPPHVPADRVMDVDLYRLEGAENDFHLAWAKVQAQADGRVIWTPRNGGHWLLTAGRDVRDALNDYEHFASGLNVLPESRGRDMRTLPTSINPPVHGPYRALLNPGLAPRSIMKRENVIREVAVAAIEGFRDRGHCEFAGEYSTVLPINVFMKLVDLPTADIPHLKYLTDQVTRPDGSMEMMQVMSEMIEYLLPHVRARRGGDGSDMLTQIASGRIGDEPISEAGALEMCCQLLLGGLDTVASFLGFTIRYLATHPEQRRVLIEDPTRIPAAVDEFFRRFPIVTLTRTITEDFEFRGVAFRKGDHVSVPTPVDGIDPREYADSLKIDFDREAGQHSTFGGGPHRCPGAFLSRVELRVTLEEWMRRIPDFRLGDDEVLMAGGVVGSIERLNLRWD